MSPCILFTLLGLTGMVALAGAALRFLTGFRRATLIPNIHGRRRRIALQGVGLAARGAPDFALRDQFGALATREDFRGNPLLVAFVYADCPDVCPTIASTVACTLDQLGADAGRLNVIAITVQPETDTPELVKEFSRKHRLLNRWRYLLGPPDEIQPLLKRFGIQPELPIAAAPAQEEGRAVLVHGGHRGAHSAVVVLTDADLRRVVSWGQSVMTPKDLLHDLRLLLDGVPAQAGGRPA